ncbi:MAG TPA: TatD family hydrolase [Alphaproteobacteria bacterium]|nr:TatD family hydrolase [Alphaproteobacteria bacterium]
MLIDSHCHLNFPEFRDDLNVVLENARAHGVKGFLTVNTKLCELSDLKKIAGQQEDVVYSVGVHPHEAQDHDLKTLKDFLLKEADNPKMVAFGETGLDYYYEHSPKDLQQESFRLHLEVACQKDLPIIIHTRLADEDTLKILDEFKGKVRGVFHCFSGSKELAKEALDRGFYLSVSGIFTFKNACDLREVFIKTPLEKLLVETDAPYLAPVPYRGKRNEPAFVKETAMLLADIKNIPLLQVAQITTQNFKTLFSKAIPYLP